MNPNLKLEISQTTHTCLVHTFKMSVWLCSGHSKYQHGHIGGWVIRYLPND